MGLHTDRVHVAAQQILDRVRLLQQQQGTQPQQMSLMALQPHQSGAMQPQPEQQRKPGRPRAKATLSAPTIMGAPNGPSALEANIGKNYTGMHMVYYNIVTQYYNICNPAKAWNFIAEASNSGTVVGK